MSVFTTAIVGKVTAGIVVGYWWRLFAVYLF